MRGEPKNGKHRMDGLKAAKEMGAERASRSETLDKTKSHRNIYIGHSRGVSAWEEIATRADQYRMTVKGKAGVMHERPLRSDAVIGYALIINPPEEECSKWDDRTYQKFYLDSFTVLGEIEPRIFRREKVVMEAEHFDEGVGGDNDRHKHFLGECVDENGRYCGNLIDAKLLSDINKKFPAMMRSRGWDMVDLDTTDWERYKNDEMYRKERKEKARENGKSVNRYLSEKSAEKARKVDEMLERVKRLEEQKKKEHAVEAERLRLKEKGISRREDAVEAYELEMKQKIITAQKTLQTKEQDIKRREIALDDDRQRMETEKKQALKDAYAEGMRLANSTIAAHTRMLDETRELEKQKNKKNRDAIRKALRIGQNVMDTEMRQRFKEYDNISQYF